MTQGEATNRALQMVEAVMTRRTDAERPFPTPTETNRILCERIADLLQEKRMDQRIKDELVKRLEERDIEIARLRYELRQEDRERGLRY